MRPAPRSCRCTPLDWIPGGRRPPGSPFRVLRTRKSHRCGQAGAGSGPRNGFGRGEIGFWHVGDGEGSPCAAATPRTPWSRRERLRPNTWRLPLHAASSLVFPASDEWSVRAVEAADLSVPATRLESGGPEAVCIRPASRASSRKPAGRHGCAVWVVTALSRSLSPCPTVRTRLVWTEPCGVEPRRRGRGLWGTPNGVNPIRKGFCIWSGGYASWVRCASPTGGARLTRSEGLT